MNPRQKAIDQSALRILDMNYFTLTIYGLLNFINKFIPAKKKKKSQ